MRYECPTIVRRERIAAVLTAVQSNVKPDVGVKSDVRVKDNVRPVTWGEPAEPYAAPAIAARESLEGLLDSMQSNAKPVPDVNVPSDVRVKANIVPVRW